MTPFAPLLLGLLGIALGGSNSSAASVPVPPRVPPVPPVPPVPASFPQAAQQAAQALGLPGGGGSGPVLTPPATPPAATPPAAPEGWLNQAEAAAREALARAGLGGTQTPNPPAPAPQSITPPRPAPRAPAAHHPAAAAGPITEQQKQAAIAAVEWRAQHDPQPPGADATLRALQTAMGGIPSDGRWGSNTRDRVSTILDAAARDVPPAQRGALGVLVSVLHGQRSGPGIAAAQTSMGIPATGTVDVATLTRADQILRHGAQ